MVSELRRFLNALRHLLQSCDFLSPVLLGGLTKSSQFYLHLVEVVLSVSIRFPPPLLVVFWGFLVVLHDLYHL